ncbi:MAG TPA: hypothetical protein DF383_00515 [Deltaproteobacteria bacterium]|nr:hypothetical protein [Deltaproteobacteria bacterium]
MAIRSDLVAYLSVLFSTIPLLMVWTVGVILCIFYWKQNPRVTRWGIFVFGGLILYTMLDSLTEWLIAVKIPTLEWGPEKLNLLFLIRSLINSFFYVMIWSVVLFLLFRKRPEVK